MVILVSRRFRLGRSKMRGLLDRLEAAKEEAKSLYIPRGMSLPEVENSLDKALGAEAIPPDLAGLAAGSGTGAVLFWGSPRKYLILPPFPITEEHIARGYDVVPLRSMLQRDFTVALILVRLGAYAVGVCQGEKLIASKVGTGLVHARHKKGGSSQGRFGRHREKQIEQFLNRVCEHVQEHFMPQVRTLDYLVYGGAWTTILSLQKRCPFLRQFDRCTLPPLLDIRQPRQAVLEAAVGEVWSSDIIEWYQEEAL